MVVSRQPVIVTGARPAASGVAVGSTVDALASGSAATALEADSASLEVAATAGGSNAAECARERAAVATGVFLGFSTTAFTAGAGGASTGATGAASGAGAADASASDDVLGAEDSTCDCAKRASIDVATTTAAMAAMRTVRRRLVRGERGGTGVVESFFVCSDGMCLLLDSVLRSQLVQSEVEQFAYPLNSLGNSKTAGRWITKS
jgi:type IV secretion system protein TrbL